MTDQLHHPMPAPSARRTREPALRNRDKEMIPLILVRAMFGLALTALVLVSWSVATGRPHVGVPREAAAIDSRTFILDGDGIRHIVLRDPSGNLLADMENGGFIAAVQNGLKAERRRQGLPPEATVTLTKYQNGRLTLADVESGWSVELGSFGPDNKAVFERLFDY